MICGLTSSPVNSDDAKSLRAIWVLISQWKQPPSSSEQQIKDYLLNQRPQTWCENSQVLSGRCADNHHDLVWVPDRKISLGTSTTLMFVSFIYLSGAPVSRERQPVIAILEIMMIMMIADLLLTEQQHAAYVNSQLSYEGRCIILSLSQVRKLRHREVMQFTQDSEFRRCSHRGSLVLQIHTLTHDSVLPLL